MELHFSLSGNLAMLNFTGLYQREEPDNPHGHQGPRSACGRDGCRATKTRATVELLVLKGSESKASASSHGVVQGSPLGLDTDASTSGSAADTFGRRSRPSDKFRCSEYGSHTLCATVYVRDLSRRRHQRCPGGQGGDGERRRDGGHWRQRGG